MGCGIPWLLRRTAEPDIVVIICVGMAEDEVDIIAVCGIFPADIEAEGGVITALPLLARKGDIFFEDIGWEGAGGPLEAGSDNKEAKALFQGIEIYIKVATYNTFKTCSFAFSSSSFISTTHCWIVESYAFEPVVLISRPISWRIKESFFPLLSSGSRRTARK